MKKLLSVLLAWSRTCGACGQDPCNGSTTDCPDY